MIKPSILIELTQCTTTESVYSYGSVIGHYAQRGEERVTLTLTFDQCELIGQISDMDLINQCIENTINEKIHITYMETRSFVVTNVQCLPHIYGIELIVDVILIPKMLEKSVDVSPELTYDYAMEVIDDK